MITIKRTRTGTNISMEPAIYDAMNSYRPRGCPFNGYTFFNLLSDLIKMYSWELSIGRSYTLNEFLTACNDIKAEAYKNDFLSFEEVNNGSR